MLDARRPLGPKKRASPNNNRFQATPHLNFQLIDSPAHQQYEKLPWESNLSAYQVSVRTQKLTIDRLKRDIFQILRPETQRRWIGPNRSGTRLDLQAVQRAEADPHLQDIIWQRPQPPIHHDAQVTLLLDRSGSMEGERMAATFAATVLITEVCQRTGVPLCIFTFGADCELLLDMGDPLDLEMQGRIGGLMDAANGGTFIDAALERVHAHLLEMTHTDPFVFLLSDGNPSDQENLRQRIRTMDENGIYVFGLGLGPNTQNLAKHVPNCRTNLTPDQVAPAFIEFLLKAIVHT